MDGCTRVHVQNSELDLLTGLIFVKLPKSLQGLIDNEKRFIKHLEDSGACLGSGSSRTVYRLPYNKVLKVAKSTKGRAQNEAEVKIYESITRDYVAKIFYYASDFSWVIAEFCGRCGTYGLHERLRLMYENTDIYEADEWGKNSKGKLKLIDYGGTKSVMRKYYGWP